MLKRIHKISEPGNNNLEAIQFQLPISYNGPKGENDLEKAYTPEHFFLAALAGCFITTFSVVSKNSNFNYKKIQIKSKGIMREIEGTKMMEIVKQDITLTIAEEKLKRKANRILEITEQRCPLANSVKSRIENSYNIIIE
ncbi:MAG: OsmC family protein [Promethearchaeia archaeon]